MLEWGGELSSLGSLLKSSDDGRRVLKHFEFCKSTLRKNYYVCTQGYASLVISTCMSHCLCSCGCCIHNVLLTVEHFQFFAKEFFAKDSRWWNSIRADGGHKYYRPFL